MIYKLEKKYNQNRYRSTIGTKTNIHKVSYFFKEKDLHLKKILVLDFEFSKEYNVYEFGAILLNKGKVERTFYEEYKIPKDDLLFSFETKRFVYQPENFNKNRKDLNPEWFKELINSVDYIVCHNYVAEMQCFHKMFKNQKYSAATCDLLNSGKVICTNYTLNNKFFKTDFNSFSNSNVSEAFGFKLDIKEKRIFCLHEELGFSLEIPNKFFKAENKNLHNSFYDAVITLTNFLVLLKLSKD
jgi:hypothetical protein